MVGRLIPSGTTIRDALLRGTALLASVSDSPRLDAEVLLAHTLHVPRVFLVAHAADPLAENLTEMYSDLLARRLECEPIAYLLGVREFYGRPFRVTPDILIPRPETELIVEQVLAYAAARPTPPVRIADVGTGSGCLAITLALELSSPFVTATDISANALRIAEENAHRHGVGELVELRESFLLSDQTQPLDVVVANLPYVTADQWSDIARDVREYEPRTALVPSDADATGLSLYSALLRQLPEVLRVGGAAFFEVDPTQTGLLRMEIASVFPGATISTVKDLAGRERVVGFTV